MPGDFAYRCRRDAAVQSMPAVLKEFHRQAPKGRLFLRSMNCYEIRDELLAGSLDIGVFLRLCGRLRKESHYACTRYIFVSAGGVTGNQKAVPLILLRQTKIYRCRLSSMSLPVYSARYLNATSAKSLSHSITLSNSGAFHDQKSREERCGDILSAAFFRTGGVSGGKPCRNPYRINRYDDYRGLRPS